MSNAPNWIAESTLSTEFPIPTGRGRKSALNSSAADACVGSPDLGGHRRFARRASLT
jgi:hypothetical protein